MRLNVHVKPNSGRASVGGAAGGSLAVWVKAPGVDGRANAAVLEVVAKAFGVRVRQVRLLLGRTSPRKVLEIDIDPVVGAAREAELRAHPTGKL